MKHNIFEDVDFKLEVTKDIDDHVRLTNTYKNGVHTDVEEMLLSKDQQKALKDFLLEDANSIQTYLINTVAFAGLTDPERFYLVVDREHDTVVLAAVNYDFSITMGISTLRRDVERFHHINLFSAEMKAYIVQQIVEIAV